MVGAIAATIVLTAMPAQAADRGPRLLRGPQLYRLSQLNPDSKYDGAVLYRYALVARTSRRVLLGTPFVGEGRTAGEFSVLNAYPPMYAQETFPAANPQGTCFITYVEKDETSKSTMRALRSLDRRRIGQELRVTLRFVVQKTPLEFGPTYTRHPVLRRATYGFESAHDQRSLKGIGCAER